MQITIFTAFAFVTAACNAQITSISAPYVNVVTYKTIRCSTYYASTKVDKVHRTTIGITTRYPETIYPYVYNNVTSTVPTCVSAFGINTPDINIAAAVTQFPSAVYCTKSVEIIKASYVTSPTTTYNRTILVYPTANPEGVEWAIYPNAAADTDSNYSDFDPKVLQNSQPWFASSSENIGGFSGNCTGTCDYLSVYNSSVAFRQTSFAINHRWYFVAPVNGTYKVTIPVANDITLLWTGRTAYSNWTRANAVQAVTTGNTTESTYSFAAVAGVYLPMRLVYAQATGLYGLEFKLTAPDGTVLLGKGSKPSQAVILYSCSGYAGLAVPWPEFGSEY